ncbi:complement regulator-acquiring protein [Borrelia persica]|uniref:complement regulator-acquiring protein n=1 Tax=Borrelia persica TaxID=44448 RepID=UPI000466FD5E|nr:complement regulator-acquiring protein [Borrelia persica]
MQNNILKNIITISALTASMFIGCAQNNLPEEQDTTRQGSDAAKIEAIVKELQAKFATENQKANGKDEGSDQYTLKNNLFDKVDGAKNQKYSHADNIEQRKNIYGSIDWNVDTIKKFGKILGDLEGSAHKANWAKDLLGAGEKIQDEVQKALKLIDDKKDKLNTLSLDKLKTLQGHVNTLENAKKTWITFVNTLVNDHENDKDTIKNNTQNLATYLQREYKNPLPTLGQNSEQARQAIETITNAIK